VKKAYSTPHLLVHGTIGEITLGPGDKGGGIDGSSQKCSSPGDGSGQSNSPVSFCVSTS
jgi:hypothetical protein